MKSATNPTRTSLPSVAVALAKAIRLSPSSCAVALAKVQGESALMSSHQLYMHPTPKLLALSKNATIPTSPCHAEFISASQKETLKQSRYLSGQGDGSATNPTSVTSTTNRFLRPGGVQNPFGALPVKEDWEAVILNAEGVENPLRREKRYESYEDLTPFGRRSFSEGDTALSFFVRRSLGEGAKRECLDVITQDAYATDS